MLDIKKLQVLKELHDELEEAERLQDDLKERIDKASKEINSFLSSNIGEYNKAYLDDSVIYYKATDPFVRNICKMVFAAYNSQAIHYKEVITILNTLNIQRITYCKKTGFIC